ncbi:MAG TPA: TraM recognition domain-containing protein [Candidatus Dormibacteraeota bacterium]|nr:TraM recognition domain-containing protein [Candidatus Dormibacteraeota bacterium]
MTPRGPQEWSGEGLVPAAIAIAAILAALGSLLGAEELTAHLVHGVWPALPTSDAAARAAIAFLLDPSSPQHAWPASAASAAPGRGLYWTVLAVTALVDATAVAFAVRGSVTTLHIGPSGFAPSSAVRSALGARAARRRGRVVVPGLTAPSIEASGLYLGRDLRGSPLWATREDSVVVIGPPRSGKTRQVAIPLLRRAVGPQVVVSTKHDLLEHLAFAEHVRNAPLSVIDLQGPRGLDGRPRPRLPVDVHGYDLVGPCHTVATARLTAETFVALVHAHGSTGLAGEWRVRTGQLIAAVLHAGALGGCDAHWVHRVVAGGSLAQAVDILASHPAAARDWAEVLRSIQRLPEETRGGVFFSAGAALCPLDDPDVRDLLSPSGPRPMFDVDAFLGQGRGRLFVLSGGAERSALAAVSTILVERLVACAKARAAHCPGERLVPPLLLCIDEMAESCPLRSAPELTQSGGGRGITPVFLFQAPSQLRTAWDADRASTILSNATVKLLLGGLSDVRDLDAFAKLAPEVVRPTRSTSRDRIGRWSATDSERWTPAQTAADLREQPAGRAILLFRSLRPIAVRLTHWREGGRGADSRDLTASRRRFLEAAARARRGEPA